jgi:RNA polymerase sigma factor (sigma-70 family)
MPISQDSPVAPQTVEPGPTDGQLLQDYVRRRNEAALTAIVQRHGPMVWGVCRRLLHNAQDAEDAFQATFLVLVRKADSLVPREMVANWLYGVARQTALKARATVARRTVRERQVADMPEPTAPERDVWPDLGPLLDQELSRLPDRFRAVLVLCDLEGRTRHEAARQLGVPDGTVAGWLARARAMLAKRLARRGLVTAGAAVAVAVAENAAAAAVPISVLSNTIRAATARGAVSPSVAALTQEVRKAMLLAKLRIGTVVGALLLVGIGAGTIPFLPLAAGQKDAPGAKAATEAQQTDKERLQGKWLAVSAEVKGVKLADDDPGIKSTSLTFDGDHVTILQLKGEEPVPYALDPDKKPKQMDITVDVGKGEKLLTIYELDGSKLKVHFVKDGSRPTDFDSNKSKGTVIVFEKQKG